jgi:hypothetical protein
VTAPDVVLRAAAGSDAPAGLSVTSAEHRADAHAFYPRCGLPYTGRRFAAPIAHE